MKTINAYAVPAQLEFHPSGRRIQIRSDGISLLKLRKARVRRLHQALNKSAGGTSHLVLADSGFLASRFAPYRATD